MLNPSSLCYPKLLLLITYVDNLLLVTTAYHGLVSSSNILCCFIFFHIYVLLNLSTLTYLQVIMFIISLACYYCPKHWKFLIWIYFQRKKILKKTLKILEMIVNISPKT